MKYHAKIYAGSLVASPLKNELILACTHVLAAIVILCIH